MNLRRINFTKISVPPVEVPAWNIMAIPKETRVGPAMAANIGSLVAAPIYSEPIFINQEDIAMAYKVVNKNLNPNFQVAIISRGILSTMIHVPVGKMPIRWLNIMDIPESPPDARAFGSKNKNTPAAYIAQPIVIMTMFTRNCIFGFLNL